MLPRIRGKVGQITEPAEHKDKWAFQLWMNDIGEGEVSEDSSLGIWGPYDTEEMAQKMLKSTAIKVAQICEEKLVGKSSGKYVDLKTNKLMEVEKSNEHN